LENFFEILENLRSFGKLFGNFGKLEILENFLKILENFRNFGKLFGNFGKL